MLPRVLVREKVDERTRALLDASGIRSYRQLAQRPLWDVAHAADLSVAEMNTLVAKISTRLAPRSRTAFEMFLESVNRPLMLRTGLPGIDSALCGGLHHGPIHELAGTSGIGKTQWAMTLAVQCAIEYPQCRVLYVDSEHGFSAKRLDQIARARLRGRFASNGGDSEDLVASVLQRVLVQRVDSLAAFLRCLKELDQEVPVQKIQLLIVDSIAALLVKAHELTFTQREHQLQRIASRLKYIGDIHRAFIVVTNRATTVQNEFTSFTKPLLGETWAHCVTSRFVLERHAMVRAIMVVKSPTSAHVVQPFDLTELGVEPAEEPTHGRASDIDNAFDIHDDVLRDLDLTGLPSVDPSATLRSTQQSESSAHDKVDHYDSEGEDADPSIASSAVILASDDFVSDSNDESDAGEDAGHNWLNDHEDKGVMIL